MDDIEKFYAELAKEPDVIPTKIELYHSDIYYIQHLINYKFNKKYTTEQVFNLLVELELIKSIEYFDISKEREIDKTFQQFDKTES